MIKHGIVNQLLYGEPILNLYISIIYDKKFRDKFIGIEEKENQQLDNLLKEVEKCRKMTELIGGERYITENGYLFPGNFSMSDRIIAELNVGENFKELLKLEDFDERYGFESPMIELNTTKYQLKFHIIKADSKLWIPEFNNF